MILPGRRHFQHLKVPPNLDKILAIVTSYPKSLRNIKPFLSKTCMYRVLQVSESCFTDLFTLYVAIDGIIKN
jgi:hypothetical protein